MAKSKDEKYAKPDSKEFKAYWFQKRRKYRKDKNEGTEPNERP